MYDIAIVGGGAAGLACAIEAARTDKKLKIVIIEALQKVGKKILATGNGRCNLSNKSVISHKYKNYNFASFALNEYDTDSTVDFFKSLGLFCVCDSDGRFYPMSNTSASVLDALRNEISLRNIQVITEEKAENISCNKDIFIINNSIKAKKVIIATSGLATPAHGSVGIGYKLLKSFNHTITETHPGLVQLVCKNNAELRPLKGVRVKGRVTLNKNNSFCNNSYGEILFTDYGISGIATMDMSRFIESTNKNKYCVVIDAAQTLSEDEIIKALNNIKKSNPNMLCESFLTGIVPKAFANSVLKRCMIKISQPVSSVSADSIIKITHMLKNYNLDIEKTKDYTTAQITCGGADVSEFNSNTMESKKQMGLYCAGEILDVDGGCGGFNLQWAWSSGRLAGRSAAKSLQK